MFLMYYSIILLQLQLVSLIEGTWYFVGRYPWVECMLINTCVGLIEESKTLVKSASGFLIG
jgi:hypothetical protein